MIIVIVIIIILALGGMGAAYFTHGFGLLDKKEASKMTAHPNPTQMTRHIR